MERDRLIGHTINIDNIEYYNVSTFALLTKRSEQAVRKLALIGNRLGKLQSIKVARSVLIPATELTEYRFCLGGTSGAVIRFDKKGKERTEFV